MLESLARFADRARDHAQRLGLDPGPITFHMADPDRIYELAAYGLPVRIPHWTHGRDYWRVKQQYERGVGRLYEIIFPDRGQHVAYLLEGNTAAAQKLVIAHCQGHADMDDHHAHLAGQGERVEAISLGAERIRRLLPTIGEAAVEWVLDRALAIQFQSAETRPHPVSPIGRPSPWDALHDWPVPPSAAPHPWPTPDLLGFIARESPRLTDWERDICAVTRLEGIYFSAMKPVQMLHEAWATWANARILLATDDLTGGEQIESARLLAGVITPSGLQWNPYALGYPLLEAILRERGFAATRALWLAETDAGILRTTLTESLVRELGLYTYQWSERPGYWEASRQSRDWEHIRDTLANELSVTPPRVIVKCVERGELVLCHDPDGAPCDRDWAKKATQAVADLWGASVRFEDGDAATLTAVPQPRPYS